MATIEEFLQNRTKEQVSRQEAEGGCAQTHASNFPPHDTIIISKEVGFDGELFYYDLLRSAYLEKNQALLAKGDVIVAILEFTEEI